ncbi:MAG: hypothetical protein JO083_10975, partial [Candidatus Eremiobacteraeota bacterium]|nr:hypothetical protein [Candidatus Eremiobacteraeota bacterium]
MALETTADALPLPVTVIPCGEVCALAASGTPTMISDARARFIQKPPGLRSNYRFPAGSSVLVQPGRERAGGRVGEPAVTGRVYRRHRTSHPMSDLTIRSVRARGLDLTLQKPVETASGVMRSAPLVLIDLTSDEGIVGKSYVRCYTPVGLKPLVTLIENLEPLLKGDAAVPFAVEAKLQRHFRLLGPQGLTGIAMAGIDMALWDARAKACGVPLVTLLGGAPKPIPAYASLRTMSPDGAATEATELIAL